MCMSNRYDNSDESMCVYVCVYVELFSVASGAGQQFAVEKFD